MRQVGDKLDVGERYASLDLVVAFSRDMAGTVEEMGVEAEQGLMRNVQNLAGRALVHWDEVLRAVNRSYDGLVKAASQPTRAKRRQMLGQWEAEVGARGETSRDLVSFAEQYVRGRRHGVVFLEQRHGLRAD